MKHSVLPGSTLMRALLIAGALFAGSLGTPSTALAQTSRGAEVLSALRVQVDMQRHRAWILNVDAVYVYDIPSRKLVKRIELPDWSFVGEGYSCAPDLALAPSGTAYVTSNIMPVIWEVHVESMSVRQHRLTLDADNDKDVGFTGLSLMEGGRSLVGVSSLLGSVWRIDLATGSARKVHISEPIRGACGLAVLNERDPSRGGGAPVLCVAGTRSGGRMELAPDMSSGRATAARCNE